MPIWLYCQSCQQWSKSDASMSNEKTCPLCANLYITLKPVIDSNPYKVKADANEPQSAAQSAESVVNSPAEDDDKEPDSVEPDANEDEPPGEAGQEESKEEMKSEMFDFVEVLETSESPGAIKKTAIKEDENKPAESEQAPLAPEASGGNAAQTTEESGESDKPANTHVIQVLGKASESSGKTETGETDDNNSQTGLPGDSAARKKRFRPR